MPDVKLDIPPSALGIQQRDTDMLNARLKTLVPPAVFGSPELTGLRESVSNARRKLREDFPDAKGAEIGQYAELLLGPFLMKGESLIRTHETPTKVKEKELSAILQHHLTHAVLYTSIPTSIPKEQAATYWSYCLNSYKSLKRQQDIITGMRRDTALGAWWNGLKAEIGVVKTFVKAGYDVILPEYAYDRDRPLDIDGKKNADREVLQWDLNEGIDFIVIKDGQATLVDAKGELKNRKTGQKRTSPTVTTETRLIQRLPQSLQEKIAPYLSGSTIPHIRVIVPTDENDLFSLPSIHPIKTREDLVYIRKAMILFGSLKPVHEQAILAQLSPTSVSVAA